MKNNITKLLIFVTGAAIGSIATWQMVKTKYERIAQEEINSVKEAFKSKQDRLLELNRNKVELDVYKSILDKAKYSGEIVEQEKVVTKKEDFGLIDDDIIITEDKAKEEINRMKREGFDMSNTYVPPYVIKPGEFDSYDDYETESLNYYADGVLTTIFGDIISKDDVDEIVGEDSFNHFGEYEVDTVYVRNDNRKTDYEILRDDSKYSDIYGPYETETE